MDVISSYYTSVSVSTSNVLYTRKQDSCVKEKIDERIMEREKLREEQKYVVCDLIWGRSAAYFSS